jgi:hypothetical protein
VAPTQGILGGWDGGVRVESNLPSLIEAAEQGDSSAREVLFSALYAELHRVANRRTAWLASLREADPVLAGHPVKLLDEHSSLAPEGFLEQSPVSQPMMQGLVGRRMPAPCWMSYVSMKPGSDWP